MDDLKAIAFLTESSSEHPLAKAIVKELTKKRNETDNDVESFLIVNSET